MSYLDSLSKDILNALFDFLHPIDTINLCIAHNIESIKSIRIVKAYLDKILPECDYCGIKREGLIKSFADETYLCTICSYQCYHCNTYLRDSEFETLKEYIDADHKMENDDDKFIPGWNAGCNEYGWARDDHTCGNCLSTVWEVHGWQNCEVVSCMKCESSSSDSKK